MSRIREYGKSANLLGPKAYLDVAVLPHSDKEHVKDVIEFLFEQPVNLLPSFLVTTLTTSNQIIHPGTLLICHLLSDG
jgi:hypothetical protein